MKDWRILKQDVPKGFEKFFPGGKSSAPKNEVPNKAEAPKKSETQSKKSETQSKKSEGQSKPSTAGKGELKLKNNLFYFCCSVIYFSVTFLYLPRNG